MIRILNLGCGSIPLKSTKSIEYTNVDMIKKEGIIRHNIIKTPYPFEEKYFDKIMLCHCIEHIPEKSQPILLCESRRVLKDDGLFAISYPEFIKVATNYIKNDQGMKDFWKATIYGRGNTEWDRHKALMDTRYFVILLRQCGLEAIKIYPEPKEAYNTVVICKKCDPMLTNEDIAMDGI